MSSSTTTAKMPLLNHDNWRYKRQSVPAKSISNVCRNILGTSDPSDTSRLLSDALQAEKHRAARCLNFDIGTDRPLEESASQRFMWSRVSANTLPGYYGNEYAAKKPTPTKETNADAIRREKTERLFQCKVLRPIQDSPNNRRPSSAPSPSQMTPVKKVLRPLPVHAQSQPQPVLSFATLTNLPIVTDSPPSDSENKHVTVTVNSFQTPVRSTRTSVLKSRPVQAAKERKQPKITDMLVKTKARLSLRFNEKNTSPAGSKRTRRSLSLDTVKRPRLVDSPKSPNSQ